MVTAAAQQEPPQRRSRQHSGFWISAATATLLFELPTLIARFGFGLASTRSTAAWVAPLTFGFRIHHGYIGVAAVLFALCLPAKRRRVIYWCAVIGLGLIFSDLLHHFLVLWPLTGSPQFDLVYPESGL